MSAKPYDPTPSRLAKARRDGDTPVSHDAVAVAALLGGLVALLWLGRPWWLAAANALGATTSVERSISIAGRLMAPVVAVVSASALGALLGGALQTRGLALHALRFKLTASVPFNRQTLASAARASVATILAVLGLVAFVRPGIASAATALGVVLAVGVLSACVDLASVRAAWLRRLRMSHDELRRDMREQEGDPEAKARRRRTHRSIVRGSLREVRRATFVVVNPTHVAVALRYAPPEVCVPTIVVRALDGGALRVKALARDAEVPVVENAELARELYAVGSLGPIPPELYVAVAHVVASLLRE